MPVLGWKDEYIIPFISPYSFQASQAEKASAVTREHKISVCVFFIVYLRANKCTKKRGLQNDEIVSQESVADNVVFCGIV